VDVRLPPLAALIANLDRHPDPLRRVWHLIDALEWVVKWHTAVVAGDLLTRHELPDAFKAMIAAGIRTPSLGIWVQLYRTALDAHGADRPWSAIDTLLALEDRHRIVGFRNSYAHGAVPDDATCWDDLSRYRPVLEQLVAAPIVHHTRLVRPHPAPAVVLDGLVETPMDLGGWSGQAHHALALHQPTGDLIDLWPFATFSPIQGRGDLPRFHYFNALREPRVEILNYEVPDRSRHEAFWEPFHRALPIQLWREELADQRTLLQTRMQSLLHSFAGRHHTIDQLMEFLRAGRGVRWVTGPPGIGKSAVIAATAHRLLTEAPHSTPLLVVFLRRGLFDTAPAPFLRNLALQLDALHGDRLPPPSGTVESMSDAVNARLGRLLAEGPGLALCIDGLDEAPHLLAHLPPPHPRLRLLIGARPTAEVTGFLRGYHAERSQLDPLRNEEVRALLLEVVDKYDDRFTDAYVEAVTDLSGGNPLYVRLLAEQVFQRPDALGQLLDLPPTVDELLDDTVDRMTAGGTLDDELDLLHLFAIAREALDASTAAGLLGWRTARARHALRGILEVLVEDDQRDGYVLFHDSLRNRVNAVGPDEIDGIRQRVLAAAMANPRPTSAAARYLGRQVVSHALDDAEVPRLDWLHDLVATTDHLALMASTQPPTELFDDVYRMHMAFDGPQEDALLDRLVPLVADASCADEPAIDASTVHALLGYRDDTTLIDRLLDRLIADPHLCSPARLEFRVSRGGRTRRLGDLDAASEELQSVHALVGPAASDLRARILYELGYIAFLRDDPDQALAHVLASVSAAADAGDEVGAWISRCVHAHMAGEHLRADPVERTVVLDRALPVFTEHAVRNLNAHRWIGNVHAHRVDLAARTADTSTAEHALEQLEALTWFTHEGRAEPLLVARGQVHLAAGRWAQAVAVYTEVLAPVDDSASTKERRASLLAELGVGLLGQGDRPAAERAWQLGLRCPDSAANGPGKRRIRDLLRERRTDVPGATALFAGGAADG
jgi:tetratricopeptide (TPR) repeat protein